MVPAALGFDLDHTLWDPAPFLDSFLERHAGELGLRLGLPRAQVLGAFREEALRAPAHPRLFGAALAALGARDAALEAELVGRYRLHRPPGRPYPGVPALLGRLRARGYRLFLVTDGHGPSQRHKVQALGLAGLFHGMVFTGDARPEWHKPSFLPFLQACAALGVPPGRCWYVGDNPLCDFLGPRQLGMETLGVPTGPFADLPAPSQARPGRRLRRLEDLEDLL